MPPLTDADHEERRHYLGGTDMAALAGVSRWASPLTVFGDKRPDVFEPGSRREESTMMALGHLIEPVVADLAESVFGVRLSVPRLHRSPWVPGRSTRTVACRYHAWEGANVDRVVVADPSAPETVFTHGWPIVECKWGEARRRWGDMTAARDVHPAEHPPARPPVVPEDYFVQVQHYLHVTGRAYALVAVLLGYADFRWYRVDPDPDLIDALVARGEQFWHDHVIPGVPPPPDGSEASERRLRARFAADAGTVRPATPTEAQLLRTYRRAIEARDTAVGEIERTKQLIMESMGTAARIDGPGASVSWKRGKDRTTTAWEAAATEIGKAAIRAGMDPVDVRAIVDAHTSTGPGTRPFLVTFSDDEEDSDAIA